MNADLSVAPEIAQLAAPFVPPPHGGAAPVPRTAGRLAGELSRLAAAPQRWWDLVRFDPGGPARVPVPGSGGSWLLVMPPGAVAECDCGYATLIAGEAEETGRPLRPGRVLMHGTRAPHAVRAAGHGYSVSLHRGQRQLSRTGGGSPSPGPASPCRGTPESSLRPTRRIPAARHTGDRHP